MIIRQNYNLREFNTFGISANARFFTELRNEGDLAHLFSIPEFKDNPKVFLGGGSNVLFTQDFDGLVVLNKLKGVEILNVPTEVGIPTKVGEDSVYIRAKSGENWHDLVTFAVERGYWGIENLALIPGTVGAAPMQNIGAYGAELGDVLENVETIEVSTGAKRIFTNQECELGYRDSVFKNKFKDKYFISAITLKLSKIPKPNTSYKALSDYLGKNKVEINGPKDISDAVESIRRSKLPDPKVICNAGSFFKNVFISKTALENMLQTYPEMPYFEEDGNIKIPAGWLIEQCNWKGKRVGNVGVHEKQALVLVNYGGATGEEIYNLAKQIIMSVEAKFGLRLESEVNIIGLLS